LAYLTGVQISVLLNPVYGNGVTDGPAHETLEYILARINKECFDSKLSLNDYYMFI
jgi:hypothetical protein